MPLRSKSAALDGVARHAAREILGRVARRRPLAARFDVLHDALLVDGQERARPLRHRFRRVVDEPVSERTALAAQGDALHDGLQRRLIQIIDEVPAEHDVGRLAASRGSSASARCRMRRASISPFNESSPSASSTISSRQRNLPSARIVALCAAPRSSTTQRPPVCRRWISE